MHPSDMVQLRSASKHFFPPIGSVHSVVLLVGLDLLRSQEAATSI